MFSPLDRDQVNRARNADVLRAQRIIGFFILITHESLMSEIRSDGAHRVNFYKNVSATFDNHTILLL